MRLFQILFTLIVLYSCSSSTSIKDDITGTWQLSDASLIKESESNLNEDIQLKVELKDGEVLSFFKDSTYTQIKSANNYTYGTWKIETGRLFLSPANGKESYADINIISDEKDKTSKYLHLLKNNIDYEYANDIDTAKSFQQEAFYHENNLWRVKPAVAEDTLQLYKRMGNYFKHMALILKTAVENESGQVSFLFSQGPVRIYKGGIGIYSFHLIPEHWYNGFYDKTDAEKAYNLYKDYLGKEGYKAASTGNWMKDDYNILINIYNDFDKMSKGN